jgi:plasmid stabilization system protein ParE
MKFTVREEANEEAASHIAWYAQRNPDVAERLRTLLAATTERIALDPLRFPLLELRRNPGNIRRARLRKFPIIILYQLLEDEIYVFAVAHTSQRPGYWRSRLHK